MNLTHILCIDDDVKTLDDIYNTLTPQGYLMTTARTGREGIEAAQKMTPHIILLDLILPDMNAFEVVQELRDLSGLKHVPIVAFSAGANHDSMPMSQEFDAYLAKPVVRLDLFNLLNEFTR